MICFEAIIKRFDQYGEKTGWTYIEVPPDVAQQLNPNNRKSFRVKGTFDAFYFEQVSALPMGEGYFIIPFNAIFRKGTNKNLGAKILICLMLDTSPIALDEDLITCLEDSPMAKGFFEALPQSHQRYFSKWIQSAKTQATKTKRILMTLRAMEQKMSYPEMIRAEQKLNEH